MPIGHYLCAVFKKLLKRRPEWFSGLLFLSTLLPGAVAGEHSPFNLLTGDLTGAIGPGDAFFVMPPDDTGSRSLYDLQYAYNDFYHEKEVDAANNRNVLADRIIESECTAGRIMIKRPHWAIMPSWDYRNAYVRWSDANDVFRYSGALSSRKISLNGWAGFEGIAFAGSIGWNSFDTNANNRYDHIDKLLSRLETPGPENFHYDYSFAIGSSWKNVFTSLYIKKILLPAATARILNPDNGATATFSLLARQLTFGCYTVVRHRLFTASVDAGYSDIFSDTGSSAHSTLPVTAATRAVHGKMSLRLPAITLQPDLALFACIAQPVGLRAFDGPGGPFFFRADSNALVAASGEFSCKTPWGIETGLSAEYFSFNNNRSGRLDPYPFSNMSVFDPDKYKIDGLVAHYASFGAFAGRSQNLFPWWKLEASLTAARVITSAVINTRRFDFTYLIPFLTDPEKTTLVDEDQLLVIVSADNSFTCRTVTLGVNVRQAVPFDLKKRNGPAAGPGPAGKKSAGGGTRLQVKVNVPL